MVRVSDKATQGRWDPVPATDEPPQPTPERLSSAPLIPLLLHFGPQRPSLRFAGAFA